MATNEIEIVVDVVGVSQAEKDLKERGVEGFKAAYGNDPQRMSR